MECRGVRGIKVFTEIVGLKYKILDVSRISGYIQFAQILDFSNKSGKNFFGVGIRELALLLQNSYFDGRDSHGWHGDKKRAN